jgi:cellulose synthase/poly-beta-1,6-N-acetylglucosamine synthase-like glycosyltransferase
MISFIVPAHNEELWLPRTLGAIQESARVSGEPHEVIVVNDASTDRTEEVARQHGATVLNVNHRQIAATRNSGARAARGERLFFVDADTLVTSSAVKSALRSMDSGAVGGGALTRFEGEVPLYAHVLMWWLGFFTWLAGLSGGAFMFCTRAAFDAVNGFDERLYGAEDAAISAALKREGRFVVLRERLFTSGRRVRSMSGLKILALLTRIAFVPSDLNRRSSVEKVWYQSNRQKDEQASVSLGTRVSNGIALVILLVLITIPIWIVPWPAAVMNGPFGYVKRGAGLILAHTALVLWPCAIFLLRNLFQQKRWPEKIRTMLLILVSLWFASRSTLRVYGIWAALIKWLTG